MNTDQLNYFLYVCRLGTINSAAKQLYVTPQTISASIKKLEDEIGFELFLRDQGRRLIPSPEGERFFPIARDALEIIEEGLAQIKSTAQDEEPGFEELDLYLSTLYDLAFAPTLHDVFRKKHPDVKCSLNIQPMGVDGIVEQVSSSGGLGIFAAEKESLDLDRSLKWEVLGADRAYAVMNKRHPLAEKKAISISMLLRYPLIVAHAGLNGSLVPSVLERHGKPQYYARTDNVAVISSSLKSAQVITFVSKSLLRNNIAFPDIAEMLSFVPISDFPPFYSCYVASAEYYEQHHELVDEIVEILRGMLQ